MRLLPLIPVILCALISAVSGQDWHPLEKINSAYNEFSPTVSPDGSFMIFSSPRPGGLGDNDLWISWFTNGEWTTPENMRALNSPYHDHEPFLTYDGNTLLFTSDRDGGYGAGDIYASFRDGKLWSKPYNLGPPINTRDSEKMASLSMDNMELFFTRIPVDYAARKLLNDQIQIWHSVSSNGVWERPEKLPAPVNVMARDMAPRIMPDNRTLIFASEREGGLGSFDIWSVKRDSPGSPWHGLTNLSILNSPGNDTYFTFTIDQKKMFVCRQPVGRPDFDIYEYVVRQEIADPTVTLQGRVTNSLDGRPVEALVTVELATNSHDRFTIGSAPSTGQFSVSLPRGGRYSIIVEVPGFMFHSEQMDLSILPESRIVKKDIGLEPLKKGLKFTLDTIYFDGDSYRLRRESFPSLDQLAEIMKDNPDLRILIKGHVAEAPGGRTDSQTLSEQRAQAVKEYLTGQGTDPGRIETRGFGGTMPVADNKTEEGRQKNRRTEFEVLGSGH